MTTSPLLPPRIAAKITLTDPPVGRPVIGPCWTFTGRLQNGGYGDVTFGRGNENRWLLHRWTYTEFLGPIPDGLQIDHLCRNRACCNPCHLEPVTNHVNSLRGERATRTHCKRAGHELTGRNVIWREGPFGPRRQCRKCTYESIARRVATQKATGLSEFDTRHGSMTGYMIYGCRCEACREAYAEHWQDAKPQRERERLAIDARATRRRFEWTGPELELVARQDLTAKQVATMLGRTVAGVRNKRRASRIDPRVSALAGVSA